MAFTPNKFLKLTSNVTLRDYQHAARLFTDDQFRLAPKHKFLFAVNFKINSGAVKNIDLVQRHGLEIGMLVKACDLPNFTIQTETLNQYNRKKNIQYTHKYNNLNITFHDDNMGLINQLWQNYYNYYYADPSSAADAGAYDRNATKNFNYFLNTYGLDNGSVTPFFESITIYQMARHEYVSYQLINPTFVSWNHNKVDYSQNTIHDNTASIQYEAVVYGNGFVGGEGEGEAIIDFSHYDQTPSPLQGADPRNSLSPSFASNTNVTKNSVNFITNAIDTINSYQNTQELPQSAPTGNLATITQTATQGVSGVQGVAFPVATTSTTTSTATIVNLT